MFLADFGAEVIKVEPPAGDPARSDPGFAVWNRGKKSVIADPADAGRRHWLAELIAGADVCLVSEADLLAAYGLTQAALLRDCPRLVIVETPAYAGGAPWYGGRESHGLLRPSSACLAAVLVRRRPGGVGRPLPAPGPRHLGHGLHGGGAARARAVRLRPAGPRHRRPRGHGGQRRAFSIDPQRPDPPTASGRAAGTPPTPGSWRATASGWPRARWGPSSSGSCSRSSA